MIYRFMTNLNGIMQRMDSMQNQLATGKNINKPSDNPTGTARSMKLNTSLVETAQYTINTDYAVSWAESAETAFSQVTEIIQRAKELNVQGATGIYQPENLNAIANEIEQLRQQLIDLGNASNGGRYVFGGAKTTEPPFQNMNPPENVILPVPQLAGDGYYYTDTGTDFSPGSYSFNVTVGGVDYPVAVTVNAGDNNATVLGNISSAIDGLAVTGGQMDCQIVAGPYGTSRLEINYAPTPATNPVLGFQFKDVTGDLAAKSGIINTYNGDNSSIEVQVGIGVEVSINVPGGEPFLTNIAVLTNLRNALRAHGDPNQSERISNSLTECNKALETTLTARSDLGARTNRLNLVRSRLEDLNLNFNQLLSRNEDIDIAEVIMNLKMQESVQRSALSVGGRIIPPTLVEFLR